MSFKEEVGKNIRYFRQMRGFRLVELGKMTGIGKSMLSRYEKGESAISVDNLQKIAVGLQVSPMLLLKTTSFELNTNTSSNAPGAYPKIPLKFMYHYDGRVGKVVTSHLELFSEMDDCGKTGVILYYGTAGASANVAGQIYLGVVEMRAETAFFCLDNPNCPMDRLCICTLKPWKKDQPAIGIVSGISTVHHLAPMAFNAIFSDTEMTDRDVTTALKFDRFDISHIKSNNMLMPYKTLI